VRRLIRAKLQPYNFELPDYYKGVNPAAYKEAVQELNKKFEQAAKRTEALLIDGLSESLVQMHQRIEGFHTGEKKSFKDTAVTNVLSAVNEFRERSTQLGILNSDELKQQLDTLENIVRGNNAITASKLRDNSDLREDTLSKVGTILESISKFASKDTGRRRNISL
jgi:hypothetical protein